MDKFCNDHKFACKKIDDVADDVEVLKENVYGKGPEGRGGLYGELKRRVTYRTLSILLSLLVGIVGFFAYNIIGLRGTTAATDATVKALCDNTAKMLDNQTVIMQRMDTFNARQLRVMNELKLDPKWGE